MIELEFLLCLGFISKLILRTLWVSAFRAVIPFRFSEMSSRRGSITLSVLMWWRVFKLGGWSLLILRVHQRINSCAKSRILLIKWDFTIRLWRNMIRKCFGDAAIRSYTAKQLFFLFSLIVCGVATLYALILRGDGSTLLEINRWMDRHSWWINFVDFRL